MSAVDPAHAQIFAARLMPHRSLSRRGFKILFLCFIAAATLSTLPFFFLGAWPVVGFMGLDVVLFWFAFRVNFRDARAYEDISVTPLELAVAKVSAKGARREWVFNPLWVRLQKDEDPEFGLRHLRLVSRGRELEIAYCLDQDTKAQFAHELALALAEARRGPRYS